MYLWGYLKGIVDDSVFVCDKITSVTGSVSSNVANTISTNVTCTKSINSDDKKLRYKMNSYILHKFLILIKLLFMITIIFYHYWKHRSKRKNFGTLSL